MFCTVNIADFQRTARLHRSCAVKRICPQGLPEFRAIELNCSKRTVDWHRVARLAQPFENAVLLQKGLSLPEDCGMTVFEPAVLPLKAALFNAVERLGECRVPPVKRRICVVDPMGILPDYIDLIMPLAAVVRVVTNTPELYITAVHRVMENFGAALPLTASAAVISDSHAVITAHSEKVRCLPGTLVFSADEDDGTVPLPVYTLPERFAAVCSAKTDHFLFACALHELCGVSERELYHMPDSVI